MKRISVVGLGYVGLPLALLAAKKGYAVTGIDLDKKKITHVNDRKDPIGEAYIAHHLRDTTMTASMSFDAVEQSDIVLVCVPTPVDHNYQPNLGPVIGAVTSIAKKMKKNILVIIESTINPGVCDEIIIPLLEKESKLKVNKDFFVSHCPERINPGDEKWNIENIPRVAGSSNDEGLKLTVEFYESIIDAHVKAMGSLKEAESVKIVENSFRDINIAFVNELARSFTKLGIDVLNVIDGAATKPFAFMPHYPSIGVGGHCIPVDPYYLIEYARGYGYEHEFLALARSINNSMPEFTVDQLIEGLGEIGMVPKESKVTLLGLSYKANVADDRESPSYKAIKLLKNKGFKVQTFDPYFTDKSDAKDLRSALRGADAVILATNHREFMDIDFKAYKIKVVIDGKNSLDPNVIKKAGIVYRGIGR